MNCGGEEAPVLVEALSVQPDPVTLPGVFQLSFQFSATRSLHSPIKVSVFPSVMNQRATRKTRAVNHVNSNPICRVAV